MVSAEYKKRCLNISHSLSLTFCVHQMYTNSLTSQIAIVIFELQTGVLQEEAGDGWTYLH
jgi:hypothetical protein